MLEKSWKKKIKINNTLEDWTNFTVCLVLYFFIKGSWNPSQVRYFTIVSFFFVYFGFHVADSSLTKKNTCFAILFDVALHRLHSSQEMSGVWIFICFLFFIFLYFKILKNKEHVDISYFFILKKEKTSHKHQKSAKGEKRNGKKWINNESYA